MSIGDHLAKGSEVSERENDESHTDIDESQGKKDSLAVLTPMAGMDVSGFQKTLDPIVEKDSEAILEPTVEMLDSIKTATPQRPESIFCVENFRR